MRTFFLAGIIEVSGRERLQLIGNHYIPFLSTIFSFSFTALLCAIASGVAPKEIIVSLLDKEKLSKQVYSAIKAI